MKIAFLVFEIEYNKNFSSSSTLRKNIKAEFKFENLHLCCQTCNIKSMLGDVKQKTVNKILLDAIVKSFYYHKLMFENKLTSEQKANTHIHRLMKLRFLPKEIITVILTGEQEPDLTINKLYAYL